jgi:hypothetical protein
MTWQRRILLFLHRPHGLEARVTVSCLIVLVAVMAISGCVAPMPATTRPTTIPSTQTSDAPYARPIDQAIAEGVKFLESSQNADGSWGTGTVSHGNEIIVSVPGSHEAFRSATTALCVMALRETGEHAAHDRGVEFLLSKSDVQRAEPMLIYNIWAHCYVVQALAMEARFNNDPRIKTVINYNIERMVRYEAYTGGWNYYDFDEGAQTPGAGATSFGTAAELVALFEAKQVGYQMAPAVVHRAILRLEQMRQPDGGYIYDSDLKYLPLLPANQPRGNMGRTQAANCALLLWKSAIVNEASCRAKLDFFFRDHAAIEAGRKLDFPHRSWYQTSGYYYYFDHYYAARLIEQLGPQAKKDYAQQLTAVILPHQEVDGSWWDYPMWDYHKPYGTAFAIMTLLRCK